MTELILLLAMWPYHHEPKQPVKHQHSAECQAWLDRNAELGDAGGKCSTWAETPTVGDWDAAYAASRESMGGPCTKSGNVWFYTKENVTGIGASCGAAKADWKDVHIDPVRMSRS